MHVCHIVIFLNAEFDAAFMWPNTQYLGMYGTYLIAKDQLYLDKACRVNLATWLEENGWNASFCSSSFDTHGDELLEDIRNKVKTLNENEY